MKNYEKPNVEIVLLQPEVIMTDIEEEELYADLPSVGGGAEPW